MKNFIQPGETVTLVAPYDVASGAGFLVGAIFAVAVVAALNGSAVEGRTEGVVDLPRTTGAGTDWTPGTRLYWDNAARTITKTAAGNTLIGVSVTAAAVGDATGRVRLNGSF